ncbi:MAG TPA: DNA repair protein RecN [Solirubrobacteraceae bacterium]|jgi:DNA repair protein RecN (Recombination protein N)
MLCELRVENLLLIGRAELAFAPGLNVLTGETGAGKTVLAHALDLLMGGRSRARIVRPGCEEAYVEGTFAVPEQMRGAIAEYLPENVRDSGEPDEVVLGRRVSADGRTRAYVNGRAATVSDLRELGSRLVSFYGQHEHRKLVLASSQLQMLDAVCGAAHAQRLGACAATYREVQRLEGELERLGELAHSRELELELLEHELEQIEEAAPEEEEHRGLLEQRERLRRLEGLRAAAGMAADALAPESGESSGAAHLSAAAAASLDAMEGVDRELDELAARCKALAIESQDLAGGLRAYCEAIEGEDGSIEAVEERLDALDRLMRKYGGTIASVIEHGERARERYEELQSAAVAFEQASGRLASERKVLEGHVKELRVTRAAAAERLGERVREELGALAMGDATFVVVLSNVEARASGGDAVEFTIAPNPGVQAAPLREIASGGELSRVMLALTSACNDASEGSVGAVTSTLVFDEVDAGIGGHTARAVGERLQGLAKGRQVVCITHLPQIASLAQRHFSIAKDTGGELASANVVLLDEGAVVSELVRMLGADEQDRTARRHAQDLRKAA